MRFKAEDMDGKYFPQVRVNENTHGYIIVNESPEGTMEGAQKLANLFASAPEMYEALKECIQWIEQQNVPEYKIGPRIAEYKKLLAKAEGREV